MKRSIDKRRTGEVAMRGVRLTHPDKVLFADQGITKQDLALYLLDMAPRLLPHAARRLISLVRCPEGQGAPCFFQRHPMAGFTDAVRPYRGSEGKKGEAYIFIEDVAGLLSLAQMGVLEIHLWGSHIDTLDRPDRVVFDVDPAADVPFDHVKAAALRLRDLLDTLGLTSFAMLTGGKGMHVVVPLVPEHGWETVKAFSRALAERMTADHPGRYVATMSKSKRRGKIFIDFFRNDRSASAIAPYSPRARPGAPLAWPVSWSALPRVRSANEVTIENYRRKRSAGDPWQAYRRTRQRLTDSALKALGVRA
jgi:bifunctional non-homologous end joining protein LigD